MWHPGRVFPPPSPHSPHLLTRTGALSAAEKEMLVQQSRSLRQEGRCCPLLVLSLHLSPQRRETPLQQGSWESFTNCPLSPGHTLLNQSVHSINLLSQSSKRRLENRASWKENDPQIRCYSYTRTNSQIALQSPGVPLQRLQRRVNPHTQRLQRLWCSRKNLCLQVEKNEFSRTGILGQIKISSFFDRICVCFVNHGNNLNIIIVSVR